MYDKRSYIRYVAQGRIIFKPEGDAAKALEGQLLDIGFLGLSAFLKEGPDLNAIVSFELIVDFNRQRLLGKGKISHVTAQELRAEKGFKIGLKFIEIDKDEIVGLLNNIQAEICRETRKRWESKLRDVGPF